MRKLIFSLSLCMFLIMGHSAQAAPFSFDLVGANDDTLTARVTAEYFASSSTLSLVVNNTTQTMGTLTGLAFNLPGDGLGITSIALASGSPTGWKVLAAPKGGTGYTANSVSTPQQFGMFDVGLITGKTNLDGGKPSLGIAMGQSMSFDVIFSGAGAAGLSTAGILSALSFGRTGDEPATFLARFQATTGGSSDVATPATTPVPAAVWLLGTGLAGLFGLRQRHSC